MKWVTYDYKGNEQIWYSGDVIEKIYDIAKNNSLIYHDDEDVRCLLSEYKRIADFIESEV